MAEERLVDLRRAHEVREIVKLADQRTGQKHKATLRITEEVNLYGVAWFDGTKNEYTAVHLGTKTAVPTPSAFDNPRVYGGPGDDVTVKLPPDVVIVQWGWFCGKRMTATVHIRPDNVAKLLE